jgi:hypothetical protein
MLSQQLSPVQAMQWPIEKHLMTAQIAPKPSQHRQDRIRALHNLQPGTSDKLQQLQASIETETRATYNLPRHAKE